MRSSSERSARPTGRGWLCSVVACCCLALWLATAPTIVRADTSTVPATQPSTKTRDLQPGISDAREDVSGSIVYAVDGRAIETALPPTIDVPTGGETIVAFAQQYLGYPYVWAGNTPAGFDCSGFSEFVILNVLGIDIGHGLEGQPGVGAWVEWGNWQLGDLVFFQNTYQAGLSHVGIYIGDGRFIHAENEGTGVTISSLYSDYYGPRYWGATRLAG